MGGAGRSTDPPTKPSGWQGRAMVALTAGSRRRSRLLKPRTVDVAWLTGPRRDRWTRHICRPNTHPDHVVRKFRFAGTGDHKASALRAEGRNVMLKIAGRLHSWRSGGNRYSPEGRRYSPFAVTSINRRLRSSSKSRLHSSPGRLKSRAACASVTDKPGISRNSATTRAMRSGCDCVLDVLRASTTSSGLGG